MPLRRSDAIVLRTHRVGEADKVVVFLTRDLGKLRGLAKGARRSRSRFGGSLEAGTEVEVTFFEREGLELVSVDRCEIVHSGFLRLGDPVLACTLGYLADLVDVLTPEREPNPRLFRLVSAAVGSLASGSEPEQTARYVEAWLLRLGGFYPRARVCATCEALLFREGARYLVEERKLLCQRCGNRGVALSSETLKYLDTMWREAPRTLPPPVGRHVLEELAQLHQKLISQQIDRELASHQVLQDVVRWERRT